MPHSLLAQTRPVPSSPPPALMAADADPKSALRAMEQALAEGDENGVFDSIALTDERAKIEAPAIIGLTIAIQQLNLALSSAFDSAPASPYLEKYEKAAQERREKSLDSAKVLVTGETAQITSDDKPPVVVNLVRDNGRWKIDFVKTIRVSKGPFNDDTVADAIATARIYRDVTAEVKEHRYKTRDDANEVLRDRLAKSKQPADSQLKVWTAEAYLTLLEIDFKLFESANGRFPTTAEGLDALVRCPKGLEETWKSLQDKVPLDPWGNPYIYVGPTAKDPGTFSVSSAGPDGKPGTADDITAKTKR